MLFHLFPTDAITVRLHFVTMNSDFEQFLYVYSRFLEFDLKKYGLYKTAQLIFKDVNFSFLFLLFFSYSLT